MQKKHNVVMLPSKSENPVDVPFLQMNQKNRLVTHCAGGQFRKYLQLGFKPQHLCVLSDEKIQEKYPQIVAENNNGVWTLWQIDNINDIDHERQRVIIASTDGRLHGLCNKCGYFRGGVKKCMKCSTDSVGVPKINNRFIQKYVKLYNEGKPITEIMAEYEDKYLGEDLPMIAKNPDTGAETMIERHIWQQGLKLHSDGSIIIHPIDEMFTRNEVRAIVEDYDRQFKLDSYAYTKSVNYTPEEWFDKNY